MTSSSRDRYIGFALLAITSVGWGLNWPTIKIVLRDWPPLFSRGTAGVVAAIGLACLAHVNRQPFSLPPGGLRPMMTAAALNVFAWMGFSTIAMLWLTVSEAALLVYTMPIWAMLLAWPIRGERPTRRGILALALGIVGLLVLFVRPSFGFTEGKLLGMSLTLAAAVLFAFGTVAIRQPVALPPLTLTAWQVGLGCLPMVALGFLFERPDLTALSPGGWAAMAYMAAVPMGACYLSWFAALRRVPAATASTTTLLVPVIGVVSAAVALGESLGLREVGAVALTLGGVFLAMRRA